MTSSSAFARGDVVTVEFPFAEGAGTKDRPALIWLARTYTAITRW